MLLPYPNQAIITRVIECPLGRVIRSGFYTRLSSDGDVDFGAFKKINAFAMTYVTHASGRYFDKRGNSRDLTAGDLVIVPPGAPHRYGPKPGTDWQELCIVFAGPVFDLWLKKHVMGKAPLFAHLEPLMYWFHRFQSVVKSADDGAPVALVCRFLELIEEMYRHEHARGISKSEFQWLNSAKIRLEDNVAFEDFRLEQVADDLGDSYTTFRKKFTRLAKVSPAKYHMKAVIHRACELILREHLNNKELAYRLGFCNEFHFSKRFKQIVGISPKEFRMSKARDI